MSSPPVALLKLMFLWTWDGYLMESLDFPKRCQATCCIWCVTWDSSWANAGEMHFILRWLGTQQYILYSWGDIRVLLVLWQCSWVFYGVQSRKSRFLTSLIGNTEFLCRQCRGIGPHLAARGKSHEFSWAPAGTRGIFSSYGVDFHSKLLLVHDVRSLVYVWRIPQEHKLGFAGQYGSFGRSSGSSGVLF